MSCSFHAAWAAEGERALSFLAFLSIRPAPQAHPGGVTAAENTLLWVWWLRTERSRSAWTSLRAAAALLPIIPSHTDCWMLSVLQSQPPNDMVKKELDMSCLLPSSAVFPLWSWQTSLLWSTHPELYVKNKGDSSSRTLRHVTGVLDEDTSVQRPCPPPHTIPECILTKASLFWCYWYQFAALWRETHHNLMVVLSPYSPLKCHMWTSRSCWQSRGILNQRAHVFLASGFFLWAQNHLLRSWCCCASAKFSPCCSFKYLPGFLNILAIASLVTAREFWKNCLKVEKQESIPNAAKETFLLQEVKEETDERFSWTLIPLGLQQDVRRHQFSCLIFAFCEPMETKKVFKVSQAVSQNPVSTRGCAVSGVGALFMRQSFPASTAGDPEEGGKISMFYVFKEAC